MVIAALWILTLLFWGFDVYGMHRLASTAGLRRVRWQLVFLWGVTIASVLAITRIAPGQSTKTATTFSLNLPLALLFFTSAATGLHPGSVLKPMAIPERKPIGEMVTDKLVVLFELIVVDTTLGTVLAAAHFAGWLIPWWLFAVALILWALHFRKTLAACSYIGEPLRTIHRLVGTWDWAETPYDDIISRPRSRRNKDKVGKPFDVFVSYKSEDVAAVRPVVDLLIAGGLKVWFAEYMILLANWENFQDHIDAGIRQSKYGLLFTNDLYIKSEFCQTEVKQLLDPQNCGYERVLEVKNPDEPQTHRDYPQLAYSPAMDYDGCHRSVLEFIQRETSLSFDVPSDLHHPQKPQWYRDRRLGYRIDVAAWEQSHERIGAVAPGKVSGPSFIRNLGGYRATLSLDVGPPDPEQRIFPKFDQPIDDQKVLRELFFHQFRRLAHLNLERMMVHCRGVHLLLCGGFGHSGVTYWNRHWWQREYSIVLPNPHHGEFTEFHFTFRFRGPFKSYCKYTCLMDRLVTSLEW